MCRAVAALANGIPLLSRSASRLTSLSSAVAIRNSISAPLIDLVGHLARSGGRIPQLLGRRAGLSAKSFETRSILFTRLWPATRSAAPASVRKVHRVLSMILAYAAKDGRLAVNPAAGVSLPRVPEASVRFLTHRQVHELADACGDAYRLTVLFLAYTGLRWGEMAALQVGRIDFLRRQVLVAESGTPVKGVLAFGPRKGHERCEVSLPRFVVDELARHVEGRGADDPLFIGGRGAVMRSQTFQRAALTEAAERLGVPGFHPHELRHTATSLAIASGADVKVV